MNVQHEILDLLHSLQSDSDMAMILVSHDLAVVSQHTDRIGVMCDMVRQPGHFSRVDLSGTKPGLDIRVRLVDHKGIWVFSTHPLQEGQICPLSPCAQSDRGIVFDLTRHENPPATVTGR